MADLTYPVGDLDTYLWIAGQYREWRKKQDGAEINAEARKLFSDQSTEVEDLLQMLLAASVETP